MNRHERRALEALRFDWAYHPEDVWKSFRYHVDGLHEEVLSSIAAGVRDASDSDGPSPVGVAILGAHGAGKTHLLGVVREQVQSAGGYFFLVELLDAAAFWESVVQALLGGLLRETGQHERQLSALLRRLCHRAGVLTGVAAAVVGEAPLSRRDLTHFTGALRRLDPRVGLECQETARALVLFAAGDFEVQDIGYQYLSSMEESNPGDRSGWGLHRTGPGPDRIVKDISRLLALTGPSVIAIDQIDPLVAVATKLPAETGRTYEDGRDAVQLDLLAAGLMSLRDISRRTLSVVACLPDSWILIRERTVKPVRDRFRELVQLHRIPSAEIGRAIVERRFGSRFEEVGFDPPYPTWPVPAEAFEDAPDFTPRKLLQRVGAHVQGCLRRDEVRELAQLTEAEAGGGSELSDGQTGDGTIDGTTDRTGGRTGGRATDRATDRTGGDLAALDARFAELRGAAFPREALDPKREDDVVPGLLAAALTAWIAERGAGDHAYALDPPPGAKPALHARLRRSLDEATEDERHWAFRAIGHGHPRAVQARIRNACTAAALRQGGARRRLFLLRSGPWPEGPVTRQVVGEFTGAGGVVLPLGVEDLRTFVALRQLLDERDGDLQAWLLARQPASRSELLRTALPDATGPAPAVEPAATVEAAAEAEPAAEAAPAAPAVGRARVTPPAPPPAPPPPAQPPPAQPAPAPPVPEGPELTLGVTVAHQQPVRVSLESLRKHTVIFAGSGSGKTVLIRRLVEECALQGVSAIVLDPNNDLARLGDGWPEPPVQWGPDDARKAADYLAHTDVVVWTPGRAAGRPLSLQPLPDFGSVRADPDELRAAIDAAVAALAPRGNVDGTTARASRGRAVLHEALQHFARQNGTSLRSFVDLLADLPEGVSALGRADRIAAELAESLTAAMVIDPLFGGDGAPADPGRLLTPPPGKRARVSVISLVGLPSDEQRQSFVNQLEMALFAWIKQHPAGDRPLGGLFVLDEAQTFAPSGGMTACTASTLALATQARKYGLGLVFATQAPKALHNRIAGNAATQFLGYLTSGVQIDAARQLAQAKESAVLDIALLTTGQFYATSEGRPFRKVQTPLCLSHHPKSPLTAEEVLARAAAPA